MSLTLRTTPSSPELRIWPLLMLCCVTLDKSLLSGSRLDSSYFNADVHSHLTGLLQSWREHIRCTTASFKGCSRPRRPDGSLCLVWSSSDILLHGGSKILE